MAKNTIVILMVIAILLYLLHSQQWIDQAKSFYYQNDEEEKPFHSVKFQDNTYQDPCAMGCPSEICGC